MYYVSSIFVDPREIAIKKQLSFNSYEASILVVEERKQHFLDVCVCMCVCVCVCVYIYIYILSHFSPIKLFATLWTITRQAPLSIGLSSQEYLSGLPCLPPGDLPDPGIKPLSLISPVLTGKFFTTCATWKLYIYIHTDILSIYVYIHI